jgi:pyridoxal 5'-phosphate synthase pdxT subunit
VSDRESASLSVGVLALQGGFQAHERMLSELGVRTRQVRVPADLEGLDALVMPGGESTVMVLGIEREGLAGPLRAFSAEKPILATCAGLIMLDRDHLGVLDVTAERNAFGRQTRSFEADLEFPDEFAGDPVHAIFIRAPRVSDYGAGVEVLACVDEHPVAVRQGAITALSFHPELSGENRFHARLLERAAASE